MFIDVKRRITPVIEYVAEAGTACLVTMAQGNILAITVSHLLIASQTGVIAGVVAAAALYFSRTAKRWLISLVLGVMTAIVDFFVHPGMFGAVATEAIATGIAAAVLSYLAGSLVHYLQQRAGSGDDAASDA